MTNPTEVSEEERALRALIRLERLAPLLGLLTIRQVLEAGDEAIAAAGLNPWCVNEGRASGDDTLSLWWLDDSLADIRTALLRSPQQEGERIEGWAVVDKERVIDGVHWRVCPSDCERITANHIPVTMVFGRHPTPVSTGEDDA